MARLLVAAGIDSGHCDDLARNNANTVILLMSVGEGKLGEDPPHAGTVHALLAALREGSSLPEDEQVPDRLSAHPVRRRSAV